MAADNEPSELDVLGDPAVPVEVGSNDTEGERKGFHMVNVNPTLNIASRTPYMPPAMRRKMETPTSTGTSAPGTDFGMIGTATPWSPTTAVTSQAVVTSPPAPTAQSLFGANPWIANAGGSGPNGSYSYNQYYFAT